MILPAGNNYHSLRLRIALELADRDEDTARRVIASLWDNRNSVIDSNDAIARFVFTSSPQWNPWASAFNSRDDQRVSKTLIDKLNEWNDPRIGILAQLPQDEGVKNYVGAANSLSADAANNQGFNKVSRPGTYFLKDSSPAVFYTYAEVLFIFAESAARGWITADAETLYREAITASLNQFGIIDNRIIDSYLQQEAIRFDAAHWYESIGWQKWIAYYGQGPDAFTDWRRLGYPQLIPGPDSVLGSGELPRRFFYPVTEQSLNGKQYQIAISHQGADEITTRLWFDVANKER
ncbi:SusD/RagB family nutrient-binding outer membrane lipoprotein [Bacteroides ovatus]|nr:SusD/RagB family nutrient-binding outer membrane lipoprotein [Bacteroides ovatus]